MVIILRQCTFFIFKKDEDPLKIHSKSHDFVLFKQDIIKLRTSAKFRMTEKQLFQKPHGYNGIGLRTCNDWLPYHFTCFCLSVYCYPHWTPGNQCERDRNFHDPSRRLFSQSFLSMVNDLYCPQWTEKWCNFVFTFRKRYYQRGLCLLNFCQCINFTISICIISTLLESKPYKMCVLPYRLSAFKKDDIFF